MALRFLTRWSFVRTSVLGGAAGTLFGVLFSSIAAGVVAALVIVVATLDAGDRDHPPKDGHRTLEIDLDRR